MPKTARYAIDNSPRHRFRLWLYSRSADEGRAPWDSALCAASMDPSSSRAIPVAHDARNCGRMLPDEQYASLLGAAAVCLGVTRSKGWVLRSTFRSNAGLERRTPQQVFDICRLPTGVAASVYGGTVPP